jgi:hypothetical protein
LKDLASFKPNNEKATFDNRTERAIHHATRSVNLGSYVVFDHKKDMTGVYHNYLAVHVACLGYLILVTAEEIMKLKS